MNNKLKECKTWFLTLEGRTTLVKLVLASILIDAMQCKILPKKKGKHIDLI